MENPQHHARISETSPLLHTPIRSRSVPYPAYIQMTEPSYHPYTPHVHYRSISARGDPVMGSSGRLRGHDTLDSTRSSCGTPSTEDTSCLMSVLRIVSRPWIWFFPSSCCPCGNSEERGEVEAGSHVGIRQVSTTMATSETTGAFTSIYTLLCPPVQHEPPSSRPSSRADSFVSDSSGSSAFQNYLPSRSRSPSARGESPRAFDPPYPYSPYSPYSPLETGYPHPHSYDNQPHGYFEHRFQDTEADLRPGYTSHFLEGSYTRTNTQPTTRMGTNANPSLTDLSAGIDATTLTTGAIVPREVGGGGAEEEDEGQQGRPNSEDPRVRQYEPHPQHYQQDAHLRYPSNHRDHRHGPQPNPTPQMPPALVAYGHGYDAVRQRMIYRRILERAAAAPSASATTAAEMDDAAREREYNGYEGDYDTATTTTATESTANSGVPSENGGSGRASPLEERGPWGSRVRRGVWYWGGDGGMRDEDGGNGRGENMAEEREENEDDEDRDYEDESDRPLLERTGWSGEAAPTGTPVRASYGSNDNTPRANAMGGLSLIARMEEEEAEGEDEGDPEEPESTVEGSTTEDASGGEMSTQPVGRIEMESEPDEMRPNGYHDADDNIEQEEDGGEEEQGGF